MNNADTVFNPLKRCMEKKCHEYTCIYVHDLDFSLKRERERERERGGRERERAAKLAHALCFDAFVDVFVKEEFKISL